MTSTRCPLRTTILRIGLLSAVCAVLAWGHRGTAFELPPRPHSDVAQSTVREDEQSVQFRRRAARHLHFAERDQRRLLSIAEQELKAGRTVVGLRHLQQIIDLKQDRFTLTTDGDAAVGLRQRANDLLDDLSDNRRQTYERLFNPAARRLIEQAERTGNQSFLREAVRRYRQTESGLEAANRLAVAAFDRGDYASAAALWTQALSVPAHRDRVSASMKLRFAVALHKSGNEPAVARVLRNISNERIRIGGRLMTAGRYFERELKSASADVPGPVTPPFPRPVWTLGFSGKTAAGIRAADHWRETQRASGKTVAVVAEPLVVGRRIIFRDYDGIRSVDRSSGRTLWFHETKTTLTNRLKASPTDMSSRFADGFARNERLTSLSSDRRRVYFVDDERIPEISHRRSPFGRRVMRVEAEEKPWNRLIAIDSPAQRRLSLRERTPVGRRSLRDDASFRGAKGDDAVAVAWSLGGPAKEKSAKKPFAGHFFHGPPLATLGRLFIVSEHERVLRLSCLNAADGHVVWTQPLANSSVRVESRSPSIRLVYSDGLLVCATPAGFLTAVDAVSGSLRWAIPFREDMDEEFDGVRFEREPRPHSGFVSPPIVRGGRVMYLPPAGGELQCFDLKTGRRLWRSPREETLFVDAVDADTVVAVSRRETRGLSLLDGRVRWRTATGQPTGRGLATKERYLLPTRDGRIVAIDHRSGRPFGLGLPGLIGTPTTEKQPIAWRPGNLAAAGDVVLSIDHNRLRAFPQSGPLFATLKKSLDAETATESQTQTAAELALLLGRTPTADRLLSRSIENEKLDPKQRQRAERLLRELLYRQLKDGVGEAARIVARLDRMSKAANDRVRFLMAKTEWHLRTADHARVMRTIDEFAELKPDGLFPAPNDSGRLVSLSAWSAEILQRIDKTGRGDLHAQIEARMKAALKQAGVEPLERFLVLFGSRPEAAPARNELARRLMSQHDDQRAELLLLHSRRSAERPIAAVASELLRELWVKHKLYESAAELRDDAPFRGAKGDAADPLLAIARKRVAGPQSPVRRVDILPQRDAVIDPDLQRLYSNFRQIFPTPANAPFELLDVGDRSRTEMTIVDRATEVETGRITIPTRHSFAGYPGYAHVGQYLSLGSFGKMHGISLLERHSGRPLWTVEPFGFDGRSDMLHVGPAGASYAVYQAHEHLIAVDPGTGRILWQRSDQPPGAGLIGDPYSGIFGDDRALVVLRDADEPTRGFTVYNPATGARIRSGQLSISGESMRRTAGRFMQHTANVAGKTHLRIWDPLHEPNALDLPVGRGALSTEVDDRRSIVLSSDGALRIVDIPTAGVRTLHTFDATEMAGLNYIKAFAHDGRLFINFQRPRRVRDTHFSFYLGDALLPVEHIRGELYAFDLKAGRKLWMHAFPQRSVLKLRHGRFPFLILASRLRDRRRGTRTGMLIEIIDAATGETLGRRDDLFPDRLVHMTYDPRANAIRLRGLKTAIRLQLRSRAIADDTGL